MMPTDDIITVVPGAPFLTYEQMNTIIAFQELWISLASWIRSLINNTFFETPNFNTTTEQVFNTMPESFYNIIKVFYGPQVAQLFSNYLIRLLSSLFQLTNAYKSNDTVAINLATVLLYNNASILSEFLSRINVFWDKNQWENLLNQFIKLMISGMIALQGKDYPLEAKIFFRTLDLARLMGSYMARGILADRATLASPPSPQNQSF